MSAGPLMPAIAAFASTVKPTEAPSRVLQPFQIRVLEEKQELDGRVERLGEFIAGPVFKAVDHAEKARLRTQLRLMCELSTVLGARIAAFEG